MYSIEVSNQYLKDVKLCKKRNYDLELLFELIEQLENNGKVPVKHKPHRLSGTLSNCWECHIKGNWLLLYNVNESEQKVELFRTGTHSDLF